MSIEIRKKSIKKSTYTYEGFPLIRMNSAVTRAFFIKSLRQQMVDNWISQYGRQGVGLCNHNLQLIAWLRPNGSILLTPPPFKTFQMWQMSNAPPVTSSAQAECACRNFVDPEAGVWRNRGLPAHHHHPFCQFSRSSTKVFRESALSAFSRIGERFAWDGHKWIPKPRQAGVKAPDPQQRPDEWIRRQLDEES